MMTVPPPPVPGVVYLAKALTAQEYFDQGVTKTLAKNYQGAIVAFTEAIKQDPGYAYAYFYRGSDYFYVGNKTAALADFNQTLNLNPNFALAYLRRGSTYYALGNKQAARQDYLRAAKLFQAQDQMDRYQATLQAIQQLDQNAP